MAKIEFNIGEEYYKKLAALGEHSEEIAKKAVYAGAKVVADKIRSNLKSLPEDKFRHLKDGEMFTGVPAEQKKDLLDSLGVTPIEKGRDGFITAKIGFDGYGSHETRSYPKGVPNPLLARAVESGSSVRRKTPFVRTAVNSTRKKAVEEMKEVIDAETEKIMKQGG